MALENVQNAYMNEPPNISDNILCKFNTNFIHYSSEKSPYLFFSKFKKLTTIINHKEKFSPKYTRLTSEWLIIWAESPSVRTLPSAIM